MMLVETQRKTITVGIVEPQEAIQYAISMLLNGQQDSEVVGVEATGEDGMRMLIEKRPKIAIVEVDLEGRSGFELAGDLVMRQRETKVIFYSSAMPDIYIEQATRLMSQIHVNLLPVQRNILPRLYFLMVRISDVEKINKC